MSTQNICNICGANYEYRNGRWECPACGAYKPDELSPEERTLIDTAERYLRTQHYVEAEEAFEDIIRKYPKNHEGYWGYVRARYGIKYEEDYDGKRIPTCTATSIESFTDDPDFLKAVQLADKDTAKWYRAQAEYIERIRKMWIDKASKEEPYDIFICYKDSDRTVGIEQTQDSIEAAMLYAHLQAKGYRVFFSRESLRDKVGEKYEPYIFNALSTAKIMIVYSSSAEYIRTTWLKNEWHRYIKKIEKGEKKENSLIVAYDGFSPSELPTVLASKQCIDASKHNRNFYHDLDACVDKIVNSYSNAAQPVSIPKPIPMVSALHEHKYKSEVIKGSCLSKGYTIYRCECGEEYRDNFTPLQEHTFKKTKTQEPTCTETGYEEYTCSVCGDKDKRPIAAKGHSFGGWIEKKRPTCTEKGEQIRPCSICGHVDSELIAATGHKWSKLVERKDKNGNPISVCICSQCGEENIEFSKDFKRRRRIKILLHSIITLFLSGITGLSIFTWYNYETSFHLCILMGTFSIVYPFIAAFISLIRYHEKKTKFIAVCLCLFATFVIGLNIYLYYINPFQYKLLNDDTYEISYVRNKAITEINIPEYYNGKKITSIGIRSFNNCSSLRNIEFSNSIVHIHEDSFEYCSSLVSITIPDSVKFISYGAFKGCTNLANITLGSSVESISDCAFSGCTKLTNITIPDSVKFIDSNVFNNCTNLANITLGNSVESIDSSAFSGCTSLIYNEYDNAYYLGNSNNHYIAVVKAKSTDITSCEINENTKVICGGAFRDCTNLTNITLGNSVESIDSSAFRGCTKLASITIPDSVTSIGHFAFSDCTSLTNITLGNSVESISDWAFEYCTSLTSIIIPNSVTNIGYLAFSGCSRLTIYCETQSEPSGWEGFWNFDNCPVIWGYKSG